MTNQIHIACSFPHYLNDRLIGDRYASESSGMTAQLRRCSWARKGDQFMGAARGCVNVSWSSSARSSSRSCCSRNVGQISTGMPDEQRSALSMESSWQVAKSSTSEEMMTMSGITLLMHE